MIYKLICIIKIKLNFLDNAVPTKNGVEREVVFVTFIIITLISFYSLFFSVL